MSVSQAHPARPAPRKPFLKGANLAFALIALFVTAVAVAVTIWGLAALTLAALPLVLVMFMIFIWISLP